MSRYFLVVVLVVFGCVLNGTAQEKPVHMPVIDCVVEFGHGSFDSYGSVGTGDTITLDLNAVDKITLYFKSKNPGPSYMTQPGPFRVEGDAKPDADAIKLVSSEGGRRVTIYIWRNWRVYPSRQYGIVIVNESVDVGLVAMKGTARDSSGKRESN
jgi:hypothetical protein